MIGMKASITVLGTMALLLTGCGEPETTGKAVDTRPRLTEASMAEGQQVLTDTCAACHAEEDNGRFSRISDQRKSPEGWDMTVARMIVFHGLEISDEDRTAVVKYLSETNGLAPSESAPFRYALERQPNVQELGHDPDLMKMCARCHSYARVALQRRDEDEWRLLSHMHLGQWPSAEYQLFARERDWWQDATTEVPAKLAKMYPYSSAAWSEWKDRPAPVLDGKWRFVGTRPGLGTYEGVATITSSENGNYNVEYNALTGDGAPISASSEVHVFTGYEWRGQGKIGDQDMREVYTVSEDGNSFSGRWFFETNEEIGGFEKAVRMGATAPQILSVVPASLKAGEETLVTINGVGLKDARVSAGEGVKLEPVSSEDGKIVVKATADANAAAGARALKVGDISPSTLVVYNEPDHLKVTPGYGIARVGGGGGTLPRVTAQFEAIGYLNGPDGASDTEDDVEIGPVDVDWSIENYNEVAAQMEDAKYAGEIDENGTFMPGEAGPNPDRKFGTNNAGDLYVVATAKDGTLSGKAHLIVTVQRWNTPPIY